MSIALDTNILIYAEFETYEAHSKVRTFLQEHLAKSGATFFLTWQICYEYFRIVTHPKVHKVPLTIKQAALGLGAYLNHPGCQILTETKSHFEMLNQLILQFPFVKGNLTPDFHYAVILKEHAVNTLVTADMDFAKFGFLKIINPTL